MLSNKTQYCLATIIYVQKCSESIQILKYYLQIETPINGQTKITKITYYTVTNYTYNIFIYVYYIPQTKIKV